MGAKEDTAKQHRRFARALGMTFHAASFTLRRKIIFSFLQEVDRCFCYYCKELFTSENFVITHKVHGWSEDYSKEAYYDISNVIYAHKACNSKHISKPSKPSKPKKVSHWVPPVQPFNENGERWCTGCKAYLNLLSFHKDSHNSTGYQPVCKSCREDRRQKSKVLKLNWEVIETVHSLENVV